jgi:hypothetical protein
MMIRRGRLSREDAIDLVTRHDGKFPNVYLGIALDEILDDIGLTKDQFVAICDRFTNKRLFVTDRQGDLIRDAAGNLARTNADNVTDPAGSDS